MSNTSSGLLIFLLFMIVFAVFNILCLIFRILHTNMFPYRKKSDSLVGNKHIVIFRCYNSIVIFIFQQVRNIEFSSGKSSTFPLVSLTIFYRV